ncbi:MAG: hypothetical protein ACXVC6_11885 [Bacteroidia bacterium]
MNKQKHLIAGLLGLSMLLSSCGGNTDAEKKEELKDTTITTETVKAEELNDDVSYSLPSPAQIAQILKKSGLKYFPGITNKTEGINYKTGNTSIKALNLGVYSADLSYCVINKQKEESKKYFKVCKELASELGLGQAFDMNQMAKRLESNLDREDSLLNLLSEVQMNSDNLLEESGRTFVSVISFAGAWVESMYIGTQVNVKERNTNLDHRLVEQMAIGENIIKALKANKAKDEGIAAIMEDMKALVDIYNNFTSVKEMKAKDPDVIDADKLDVSIPELFTFSRKIEEVRAKFIKG